MIQARAGVVCPSLSCDLSPPDYVFFNVFKIADFTRGSSGFPGDSGVRLAVKAWQ